MLTCIKLAFIPLRFKGYNWLIKGFTRNPIIPRNRNFRICNASTLNNYICILCATSPTRSRPCGDMPM